MRKILVIGAAIAGMALAPAASAAEIVGTVTNGPTGAVFEEKIPTADAKLDVGQDSQNSPNLFAAKEQQNVALLSNIAGLDAGTFVRSFYVWFDPLRTGRMRGTVTFANDILAVITANGELADTDYLGNPNINYLNKGARGLEGPDTFSVSGKTLTVDFRASSPGDFVRVMTSVPEPSTWMMIILGFGLIGAALRAEKTRQRPRVALS
jgi:hypothetical protein